VTDLLVFGEVNPDIVVRGVPPLAFGQSEDLVTATTMTVGSSAAIVACGAARLGTRTALVGVVGADPFGRYMLDRLTDRGVDTSLIRVAEDRRTGSSVILIPADPTDRQILTDLAVIAELSVDDVPPAVLSGCRHLHVSSWFLQQGAQARLPELLARARSWGLTTSVDPNDDPAGRWDSHLPEALPHIDVLFCNESEAQGISGTADPMTAVWALLEQMSASGGTRPAVVLKLGAGGAILMHKDAGLHVSAPMVPVVDTVGAGDSLAAGFLHGLLLGRPAEDSLRLAVACGSLSTTAAGGTAAQPVLAAATRLGTTLAATRIDGDRKWGHRE